MASIKFIACQVRTIFQYKNTRIKVLNCCASIYLNKQCLIKKIVPNYASHTLVNFIVTYYWKLLCLDINIYTLLHCHTTGWHPLSEQLMLTINHFSASGHDQSCSSKQLLTLHSWRIHQVPRDDNRNSTTKFVLFHKFTSIPCHPKYGALKHIQWNWVMKWLWKHHEN